MESIFIVCTASDMNSVKPGFWSQSFKTQLLILFFILNVLTVVGMGPVTPDISSICLLHMPHSEAKYLCFVGTYILNKNA